ncbi:FecR family protein [Patescibacteria group bacterium]|nr:FecR family protein [Patescibacteria group bacterium]
MNKFQISLGIILSIALISFSGCGKNKKTAPSPEPKNIETNQTDVNAQLIFEEGGVYLKSINSQEFIKITENLKIENGATVKTDETGLASIIYYDDSITRIDNNTELTITTLGISESDDGFTNSHTKLDLAKGHIWNNVRKLTDDESDFEIETPTTIAAVRGSINASQVYENGETSHFAYTNDLDIWMKNRKNQRIKKYIIKEGLQQRFINKEKLQQMIASGQINKDQIVKNLELSAEQKEWIKKNNQKDLEYLQRVYEKHRRFTDNTINEENERAAKIDELLTDREKLKKYLISNRKKLYLLIKRADLNLIAEFLQQQKKLHDQIKEKIDNSGDEELKLLFDKRTEKIFQSYSFREIIRLYPQIMNPLETPVSTAKPTIPSAGLIFTLPKPSATPEPPNNPPTEPTTEPLPETTPLIKEKIYTPPTLINPELSDLETPLLSPTPETLRMTTPLLDL